MREFLSDAGSLTRAVHFPRFGLTRAFAATGLPVLLRDTCASIRALAARAIVPLMVSVDPDRRARVIFNREDGAGPSVRTGGFVSTARAVTLLGSTVNVAALARLRVPGLVLQPHLDEMIAVGDRDRIDPRHVLPGGQWSAHAPDP